MLGVKQVEHLQILNMSSLQGNLDVGRELTNFYPISKKALLSVRLKQYQLKLFL